MTPIESLLKNVPFFSHLNNEILQKLVRMGKTISHLADDTIYREGDDAEGMYVILSGQVRLLKQDDQGNDVERSRLDVGDFFGHAQVGSRITLNITCDSVVVKQFVVLDFPVVGMNR